MITVNNNRELVLVLRAARDYLQKEYNALIRGETHDFDNSASIIEVTQAIADVTSLMRRAKKHFQPDEARCSLFTYDPKNENGFLLERDTSKEQGFSEE